MQQQPTVLVLASGKGERFLASGGTGWKLHAILDGRRIIDRTLDAVRATGLPWHLEDRGHAGMGDSIAAAVRATPSAAGWLVLPADLPLVKPATLCAIASALDAHDIVVPTWRGERGHPVAFAASHGDALMALSGPKGAQAVLRAGDPFLLEVDDAGIVADIDTVDDLANAERLLRASRDVAS